MRAATLIRPPVISKHGELSILTLPPIGPAYIAGALRAADWRCWVIDAVGEALDQSTEHAGGYRSHGLTIAEILARIDPGSSVIGVSCSSTKEWRQHRELLLAIKEQYPEIPIVCGGEHITALPEFSMSDCAAIDFCVLGEGEETIVDLLRHLTQGRGVHEVPGLAYRSGGGIERTPRRARIREIDAIALPAWDLFPMENYIERGISFGVRRGRTMPLLATRGCPYRCTFCSASGMWQRRWIARSPEKVVEEMLLYRERYGATNFDLYDLTAIIRKDWILRLARLIQDLGDGVTWQLPSGTRAEALDADVCRALFASRCRNISFSPESGAPAVLRRVRKKADPERLLLSMRAARQAGLNVKVNLIFGFPGETHRDVWESLWYILRMSWSGVHDLSIWAFAPYPGSELFEQFRAAGKIGEFDEAYIDAIIYSEIRKTRSWNDAMSVGAANRYRLTGYLLFYLTSLLFRPHRLLRTIINLKRGSHETRAESFLARLFESRVRRARGKSVREGVPACRGN